MQLYLEMTTCLDGRVTIEPVNGVVTNILIVKLIVVLFCYYDKKTCVGAINLR